MIIAATATKSFLLSIPAVQSETATKEFWELAPEKTVKPFITYNVIELKPASKDRLGDYQITINVWAKTLDAAANIAENIKLNAPANSFRYAGGRSGYVDQDAKESFIQLNFNLKIK